MDGFITAIILAAGQGTRMGGDKLLLPLGDRTIIAKVADEVLASKVDEVIAVLGHCSGRVAAALGERRLRTVVNRDHRYGQSTSLIAGVRAADPRATALMVILGDQPLLTSALIDRLIAVYHASGCKVARPVFRDQPWGRFLWQVRGSTGTVVNRADGIIRRCKLAGTHVNGTTTFVPSTCQCLSLYERVVFMVIISCLAGTAVVVCSEELYKTIMVKDMAQNVGSTIWGSRISDSD